MNRFDVDRVLPRRRENVTGEITQVVCGVSYDGGVGTENQNDTDTEPETPEAKGTSTRDEMN